MKKTLTLKSSAYIFQVGVLGAAFLSLALLTLAMTGCGPTEPNESSLDRIPNVPPSTRAQGEDFLPGRPTKEVSR